MTYATNIVSTYLRATDDEVVAGAHWYDKTHVLALELSPNDVWRGAGVIACFSPRTPWYRNVELARNAFETGIASGHTVMFCGFAQRILDGEYALDVLKGDKTRAFTSAIADPENSSIATIDGHAFDIAYGKVLGIGRPNIGKKVYAAMAEAYSEVAYLTGFSTAQIQAITWVTHRRIHGFDWRDGKG